MKVSYKSFSEECLERVPIAGCFSTCLNKSCFRRVVSVVPQGCLRRRSSRSVLCEECRMLPFAPAYHTKMLHKGGPPECPIQMFFEGHGVAHVGFSNSSDSGVFGGQTGEKHQIFASLDNAPHGKS